MEKNSKYSTAFHDLKQIALKSASVFSEKLLGYQNNPWHIRIMYAICDNILVQEPSIIGEDGKEKLGKIVFNSEAHGWKINLKIVIEIPRNHGKSTAISVNWSLKEVYKDPNIRILTASNTEGQSSSFLREQVGYIERCERLNEVMGKIKPNQPEKWTDTQIIVSRTSNKKDPTIAAIGVGGKTLGKRTDIGILDDILDLENTRTPEQREKIKFWVDNVFDPFIEPTTGRQIVVGTVWYKDDYLDERMSDITYDIRLQLRALIKDSKIGEGSDDEYALDIRQVFSDEVIDYYGINAHEGVFVERMSGLGERLGPFFLQLPPGYRASMIDDLERWLAGWPQEYPLAVEVRHADWYAPKGEAALMALLERHGVGRVLMDVRPLSAGPLPGAEVDLRQARDRKPDVQLHPLRSGGLALVRYIGHPDPVLNEPLLDEWAARVAGWLADGTQVYFFMHCPDERRSPALCRAFQRRLERIAAVPPLPWDALDHGPEQATMF